MKDEILVTGCSGFVGEPLSKLLLDEGHLVEGVDIKNSGALDNYFIDVTDFQQVAPLKEKNYDYIIHLAAESSVKKTYEGSFYTIDNIMGTFNLLELAREIKSDFIYASSSAVYGEVEEYPTPEDHRLNPISNYGASKASGEMLCKSFSNLYDIDLTVLRLFNVYGSDGHGVISDFIEKLEKNPRMLEVLGNGKQERDFIYIDDCLQVFRDVIEGGITGIFNVGFGECHSIQEVAHEVIDAMGLDDVSIKYGESEKGWPGDVRKTHADMSKLGFGTPSTSLREGIKNVLKGRGGEINCSTF